MNRLLGALLATAALLLASCTGIQGGSEPHDDGSSEPASVLGEFGSIMPLERIV